MKLLSILVLITLIAPVASSAELLTQPSLAELEKMRAAPEAECKPSTKSNDKARSVIVKAWILTCHESGPQIARSEKGNIKIELRTDPGRAAKILKIDEAKVRGDVESIIYYAGQFGTSQIVDVYRQILFRDNVILGDFPLYYKSVEPKNDPPPYQPKWNVTKEKITIFDPEESPTSGFLSTIDLKTGKVIRNQLVTDEKSAPTVKPRRGKAPQ